MHRFKWVGRVGVLDTPGYDRRMQQTIGGVSIEVGHNRTNDTVVTTAGPIQVWTVALTGPDIDLSSGVGLAGRSTVVSAGVFATLVDLIFVRNVPGSQDNDPFSTPEVRAWKKANRAELEQLVVQLRAVDN